MLLFGLYLILIISQVELDTTEFNNAGYNCFNAGKTQGRLTSPVFAKTLSQMGCCRPLGLFRFNILIKQTWLHCGICGWISQGYEVVTKQLFITANVQWLSISPMLSPVASAYSSHSKPPRQILFLPHLQRLQGILYSRSHLLWLEHLLQSQSAQFLLRGLPSISCFVLFAGLKERVRVRGRKHNT